MKDSPSIWTAETAKDGGAVDSRPMAPFELFFDQFSLQSGNDGGIFIRSSLLLDLIDEEKVDLTTLMAHTKKAWIALRARHPVIGMRTNQAEFSLEYTHPADAQAVEAWATSTLRTMEVDGHRFDEASIARACDDEAAAQSWVPDAHANEALLLLVVPSSASSSTRVTKAALCLSISHTLVDGASAVFMLSDLRQLLAEGVSSDAAAWGDADFQAQQRAALTLAVDAHAPPAKPDDAPLDLQIFRDTLLKVEKSMPLYPSMAAKEVYKSRHSFMNLDVDQSTALRLLARKHGLTVSPLILAVLVVRMALRHAPNWPLPPETCHTDIFPVDVRQGLRAEARRCCGTCVVQQHVSLPVAEVLGSRSKASIEGDDYAKLVLSLAQAGNDSFQESRQPSYRANLARKSAEMVQLIGGMMASKELDFSKIGFHLYADSNQDDNMELDSMTVGQRGIKTAVCGFDMGIHNAFPFLIFRTWISQGKTALIVDWSDRFWPTDEGDAVLAELKQDLLRLIQ